MSQYLLSTLSKCIGITASIYMTSLLALFSFFPLLRTDGKSNLNTEYHKVPGVK